MKQLRARKDVWIEGDSHFTLFRYLAAWILTIWLSLERNWNIRIPGFASEEIRSVRKSTVPNSHTQKIAAVNNAKASVAASSSSK